MPVSTAIRSILQSYHHTRIMELGWPRIFSSMILSIYRKRLYSLFRKSLILIIHSKRNGLVGGLKLSTTRKVVDDFLVIKKANLKNLQIVQNYEASEFCAQNLVLVKIVESHSYTVY